jgi:NTE family protein
MLQALSEMGLAPDAVIGTSVGSVNGALLAADPRSAANRLTHLWEKVTREMVFPGRAMDRVRTWHEPRTYLVPADGLREVLTRTLAVQRIEDLALPFAATCMDLLTGEVVHLDSGPLVPALLASAAVPGLYPGAARRPRPRRWRGGQQRPDPPRASDGRSQRRCARLRSVRDIPEIAGKVPVLYLPGPFPLTTSPLEFGASTELMAEAYEASRAFLSEVRPDGPGLYGAPPLGLYGAPPLVLRAT